MKKNNLLWSLGLVVALTACSSDEAISTIDPPIVAPVIPDEFTVLENDPPSLLIQPTGFYVVNEDWFGHDNGTLNFFEAYGANIQYRAYRAVNQGEKFGVTTQSGTVYGDYMYFVSKQGNRLVITDKQLKKKLALTDIHGDGRSFVGVNEEKGYLGTSQGISIFNIKTLSLGQTIAGIKGQVGNMVATHNRVFAVVQGQGIYVINSIDNRVETVIAGAHQQLTQGKDGQLWSGAESKLIRINPTTLAQEAFDISSTPIKGTWFAWNVGSLCASTQNNTLYWTVNANKIASFNTDTQELNSDFYSLGADAQGEPLEFYGSGLRVDPVKDQLILTVKRKGWGSSFSYNWVKILSNTAVELKTITVKGDNGTAAQFEGNPSVDGNYYWFPSQILFQDNHAPEILLNQIVLKPNQRKALSWDSFVIDQDNNQAAVLRSIQGDLETDFAQFSYTADSLVVTAKSHLQSTTFTAKAVSNGKSVEKLIRLDIRE